MITARSLALYCARALGGFKLAQFITRKRLRILCYHGFSSGDEHEVAPLVFMTPETFERRMQILRKRGLPVISLEEGVRRLRRGEVRNAETVITLDDGWASNLTIGLPILEKYGYLACVYMSTEHLEADTEGFNVVLSYMIHRSARDRLKLQGLHPLIDGTYNIRQDPTAATIALITAAEKAMPLAQRQQLLRPIARALEQDLDHVLTGGRFRLLNPEEIQELVRHGIDIQLHTHTHRLPDDRFEAAVCEIEQNRKALRGFTKSELKHFCYPSGFHSPHHPEWLTKLGIVSATTCDPGMNPPGTSPMLLRRYLDGNETSDIEFEAEVCGLRELARNIWR
jgi:peptidoglycan/xylan/chitin deacetylase (PgdA/CDA1 family)